MMTEFETKLLEKLDKIIDNQKTTITFTGALHGVDLEQEVYRAKYRQIKKNAELRRNGGADLHDATLSDLGIEETDD